VGLFTLSPLIAPPSAALTFGANVADAVDIGSNNIIDDTPGVNAGALFAWLRFTTFTSNRGIFQKFSGGSTNFRISGTSGDVQFACTRATTITSYITNNTPLVLGAWGFVAATYDPAATPTTHIYGGSLVLPATECTYGTAQDGSGAVSTNAAANGKIGNNGGTTAAMQGDFGAFGIANRIPSLAEIRMIQRWMLEWYMSPVIYPGLIAAYALGANGTKVQRDLTGNKNDGTVSGPTVTRGIARAPRQRIIYIPAPATTGAYSLPLSTGTYTVTGQTVALRAARQLALANGSYTLTGQAVALRVGRAVPLAVGSYTLTGQAVALRIARQLPLSAGTYTLTGQAVALLVARKLALANGLYSLTGQDVNLRYSASGAVLTLSPGSYALTGQAVALRVARVLALASGNYALAGQAVALRASRAIVLAPGVYVLTGEDVTLGGVLVVLGPRPFHLGARGTHTALDERGTHTALRARGTHTRLALREDS
jgi:hypothetical protein